MGLALDSANVQVDWSAQREALLDATNDGMDVYAHFASHFECQGQPLLYRNYPTPFPVSKKYRKGFRLYLSEGNGRIQYKDNATGRNGNCLEFVMELLGYSFKEAKQYVEQTVLHGLAPTVLPNALLVERVPRLVPVRDTSIQVWAREWAACDEARYEAVGIDQALRHTYHCYPLQAARVITAEHDFTVYHADQSPLYGYWHEPTNRWKVHRPLQAKGQGQKWYSSTKGHEDMFALHLLPSVEAPQALGIIGPGQRDSMALCALTGYTVHALNSESAHLTADQYALLTSRYQRLAFFTDPDEAGDKGAAHLTNEWGIPTLNHVIHPFIGHLDLCEWLASPLGSQARLRERLAGRVSESWQGFPSYF